MINFLKQSHQNKNKKVKNVVVGSQHNTPHSLKLINTLILTITLFPIQSNSHQWVQQRISTTYVLALTHLG